MRVERLVIDTNVWIAALISSAGTARQLVDARLDQGIDVLMSEATFDELVSRLDRPRFDRYPILTPVQLLQRSRESDPRSERTRGQP